MTITYCFDNWADMFLLKSSIVLLDISFPLACFLPPYLLTIGTSNLEHEYIVRHKCPVLASSPFIVCFYKNSTSALFSNKVFRRFVVNKRFRFCGLCNPAARATAEQKSLVLIGSSSLLIITCSDVKAGKILRVHHCVATSCRLDYIYLAN